MGEVIDVSEQFKDKKRINEITEEIMKRAVDIQDSHLGEMGRKKIPDYGKGKEYYQSSEDQELNDAIKAACPEFESAVDLEGSSKEVKETSEKNSKNNEVGAKILEFRRSK